MSDVSSIHKYVCMGVFVELREANGVVLCSKEQWRKLGFIWHNESVRKSSCTSPSLLGIMNIHSDPWKDLNIWTILLVVNR